MQECIYLLWECEGDGDIRVQLLGLTLIAVGGGGDDRTGHTCIRSEKIKIKCRDILLKSLQGFHLIIAHGA